MVVSILTSSGNCVSDGGRVPGTDTGNLTETTVRLARELLGSPSSSDTLVSVTLCDTDDVDRLVGSEDGSGVESLLEVVLGEVDLLGNGAAVDLDLHEVSLLLLETSLSDLGVGEDTNDSAVLADALELAGNALTAVLGVLLGVLGESLLLGAVPVLVEATLDLIGQVLGPNSGEGSETSWCLDVTDNTNNDHWWSLDDCDSLNDLTLVHLRSGSVEVSDDVRHTGLVTHEGSEVDGLLSIVLGESLYLSAVSGSPLSGQETQRTMSWVLKFTVRHWLMTAKDRRWSV